MTENRDKDEVRIPIPGTPAVIVESSERQPSALKSEINSEKEAELDEALEESFPASDSPSAFQPGHSEDHSKTAECNDYKEKKDDAA